MALALESESARDMAKQFRKSALVEMAHAADTFQSILMDAARDKSSRNGTLARAEIHDACTFRAFAEYLRGIAAHAA